MSVKTCILAVVLMVGAVGAGPATRPDKPIEGARGVAALIPAELLPESGQRWTELQQKNANEWAADLRGQTVRISGKVASVSVNDVVGVGVQEGFFDARNRKFMGSGGLIFTNTKTPGLSKLREGDRVSVTGRIKKVSMVMDKIHGAPPTTVVVHVTVEDPTLEKR